MGSMRQVSGRAGIGPRFILQEALLLLGEVA
jgi:hypothetical protein